MASKKGETKSTEARHAVEAWEKAWGKQLPKGYVIHHKDGNPENNSISNLQMISRAKSNKIHKKGKTLKQQKYASKNEPNIAGKEKPQRRFRK